MEGQRCWTGKLAFEVMGKERLANKSWDESKKMWHIAAPAILTAVAQFSIGLVTVAFVGHLGEVELAAVSVVENVIEGFVYGIMLGMGSALETLCGQAVGAGQMNMLGIYMQRSWIITGVTALILTPVYVFASPMLKLLHQSDDISELAGKYSIWVIPQLFAYALNFPTQKFLQSQSKVWVMTIISGAVLAFHALLNWILVTKLGHGLAGAAIAGNISWWLVVLAQLVYVVSGYFPDAWTGFSLSAFEKLAAFVKLSLASAIMLCLELWYYTIVILLVGRLKNPEIAVDAISICMNLQQWTLMIALGFNAAVSVRISNELGAKQPKAAKFSVVVAVTTSVLFGTFFTVAILATRSHYPKIFTAKPVVIRETSKLGYLLAATIFLNSIQPVLHGVAVGAGWQFLVAFINIVSYYIFGLPIGALLGYKFNLGIQGIWTGMLAGCLLQTVVLLFIMLRANWHKEALQAEERVRTWGGQSEPQQTPKETANENGVQELIQRESISIMSH
ncbi:PREDICTED: protein DETOXIFICATION 33 isoform X1 [Nelumbo nucifera]|uniref:Protein DETOXIFICATION n=1 Tax=Nelumbo nucifera TaxID=4432 RepID=A0A1U7Z8B9_NELNU|nr:PREDICTED: protein DETOXIFICATION 33 isoform X1 [Nelumbo nucifera]